MQARGCTRPCHMALQTSLRFLGLAALHRKHPLLTMTAAKTLPHANFSEMQLHAGKGFDLSKVLRFTVRHWTHMDMIAPKTQLRDVGGKVIMCLNDRRPQGIWQAVKWRAIPDGFKQSFKVRNSQQGCRWRQCFLLKGNSDQRRCQIGKEDVGNILSRKNSSQIGSCDDWDLVWRLRITIARVHCCN